VAAREHQVEKARHHCEQVDHAEEAGRVADAIADDREPHEVLDGEDGRKNVLGP
jgi:hypothetical protein